VLEGVSRLVHLHLLQLGAASEGYPEGEPRFGMLATIQEFGREQLVATEEMDAARRRHAAYFLTLAEEALPLLYGDQQIVWYDRLEDELDNLRAAWGWCLARAQAGDQEAAERGMATAGNLYNFWQRGGHFQEGWDLLTRLLATPVATARTRGRVIALWSLALMNALFRGDLAAAALGEESVVIARELGDRWECAGALFCRGIVCGMYPRPGTDDLTRGCAYLEEARTLYEQVGKEGSMAQSLVASTHLFQGIALLAAGDVRNAETQSTRGLELATAAGDRHVTAMALNSLGSVASARGDLVGARALLERGLTHHEALRNRYPIGWTLTDLGDVLRRMGESSAAQTHYARALRMLHAVGHAEISHRALCGLAELAAEAGEPARTLCLASVSGALSALTGVQPSPPMRTQMEQVEAAAREVLSPEAQAAAWAAGQAMPLEQVIAEALAQAEPEAE
jgi:tetratricopeptide (TPR) repeat protein